MASIHCPGCGKQSPIKIWDFLPWLNLTRERFRCRNCQQWFLFSDRATRHALIASIATIFAAVATLWLYFQVTGTRHISGWPGLAFFPAVLVLVNLASAFALKRYAELVGPIDYAP
jgi:hypothetical protein